MDDLRDLGLPAAEAARIVTTRTVDMGAEAERPRPDATQRAGVGSRPTRAYKCGWSGRRCTELAEPRGKRGLCPTHRAELRAKLDASPPRRRGPRAIVPSDPIDAAAQAARQLEARRVVERMADALVAWVAAQPSHPVGRKAIADALGVGVSSTKLSEAVRFAEDSGRIVVKRGDAPLAQRGFYPASASGSRLEPS